MNAAFFVRLQRAAELSRCRSRHTTKRACELTLIRETGAVSGVGQSLPPADRTLGERYAPLADELSDCATKVIAKHAREMRWMNSRVFG
jgi:hypothetical protein